MTPLSDAIAALRRDDADAAQLALPWLELLAEAYDLWDRAPHCCGCSTPHGLRELLLDGPRPTETA